MKSCKSLKGGLQEVADDLQVPRIGPQHQAGSDSLLTSATFFKMRSKFFEDTIDPKYMVSSRAHLSRFAGQFLTHFQSPCALNRAYCTVSTRAQDPTTPPIPEN